MNDLSDMETRAQRHRDGMRVNTDWMAKDVLALVASVRALQQQAHEEREPAGPVPQTHSSFQGALNEVWSWVVLWPN